MPSTLDDKALQQILSEHVRVLSAEEILGAMRAVRDAALKEAVEVCARLNGHAIVGFGDAEDAAQAIRALIPPGET